MLISSVQTENQKFALNETGLSSVRLSSFIVTCFSSYSIFTGSLSVALKQLKISLFAEYSLSTWGVIGKFQAKILLNNLDQKNEYEKLIKRNPCIFDLRKRLEDWCSFFQLFRWMWRPIRNSRCCKFEWRVWKCKFLSLECLYAEESSRESYFSILLQIFLH